MKCTCRDSIQPCPRCQKAIDAAVDNDWFFDTFAEGWATPPGGELW